MATAISWSKRPTVVGSATHRDDPPDVGTGLLLGSLLAGAARGRSGLGGSGFSGGSFGGGSFGGGGSGGRF